MEKFIHLEQCDSTQDTLKEQLSIDDSLSYIISTDKQLKGHGRNGKSWHDSIGTLCFSLNLKPHATPSFSALEISLILYKFFAAKGVKLGLKWPNDLLNQDKKKCAGILLQNYKDQYLAGIGINLYLNSEEFGGIYQDEFSVNKEKWSQELALYILNNRYQSTASLISDWNQACIHLNQTVSIIEGESIQEGVFLGLGEHGQALIQTNQGSIDAYNGSLRIKNLK